MHGLREQIMANAAFVFPQHTTSVQGATKPSDVFDIVIFAGPNSSSGTTRYSAVLVRGTMSNRKTIMGGALAHNHAGALEKLLDQLCQLAARGDGLALEGSPVMVDEVDEGSI